MDPKVSVIVPVYNTEKYLEQCLNSILSQTLREIEIIIINDASPDNSIYIINEFQKKDNRIVCIDKRVNQGVGQARNDGIVAARGEFVCFIDSDDLYSSDTVIEKLYSAAKDNNVQISGGMLEHQINESDIELVKYPKLEYGLTFDQFGLMKYSDYQYDCGYTQYIFNRLMLNKHNILFPKYSRFQDPPFFVKAMCTANEFYFINEPIYRYRIIASESKYTIEKTLDMLNGIIDNLCFSRNSNLPKLHCLSAFRLNKEGSFMAIQNLYNEKNDELLSKLIEANQAVDVKWLIEEGYDIQEPFVLDVFKYAVNTASKYEKLRNKRLAKALRRIIKK